MQRGTESSTELQTAVVAQLVSVAHSAAAETFQQHWDVFHCITKVFECIPEDDAEATFHCLIIRYEVASVVVHARGQPVPGSILQL